MTEPGGGRVVVVEVEVLVVEPPPPPPSPPPPPAGAQSPGFARHSAPPVNAAPIWSESAQTPATSSIAMTAIITA